MYFNKWNGAYNITRYDSRAYAGYYAFKCNDGKWTIDTWVNREQEGKFKTFIELKKHYGWY